MKVAICIMIKNENMYIREWVDYHKNLGFDNIILYDNNDSNGENVYDVLSNEINNGFIIYENIKDKIKYQLPCYNECLNKYHKDFDWILFIDCDEFIELKNCQNIKSWLQLDKFNEFEQIVIELRQYGDNDLLYYDSKGVLERFTEPTHLTLRDSNLFQTKPIYRTQNYIENQFINTRIVNCFPTLYNSTCDTNGNQIFPSRILFTENPDCVIRHFKTKTISEFIERHKTDCFWDMNIQLVAKKLKGFFEVSTSEKKIDEKIRIIQNEFPWYRHTYSYCEPIDIVLVNDNNPLLKYSIASIKENLQWANNIFVVSKTPEVFNDAITILYDDIIPTEFDSDNYDIGLFLHNIKELSERFIYVYNGTLFNYICFEDEFFKNNKVCMIPCNFEEIPLKYKKMCYENNNIFLQNKTITTLETFCVSKYNVGYMFSRTCCPMLKSDNDACLNYLHDDILKSKNKINHLIYPTWSKLMYHTFIYIHSNISLSELENKELEIEDPIYKIINVDNTCINYNIINILCNKYGK